MTDRRPVYMRNRDAIQAQYDAGVTSPSQIAKRVGLSERTVLRHLREIRGPIDPKRNYGRPIPQHKLARAREMLEDRAGYAETSRTLGVTRKSLGRIFPGMGLTSEESIELSLMAKQMKEIERGSHAEHIRYV